MILKGGTRDVKIYGRRGTGSTCYFCSGRECGAILMFRHCYHDIKLEKISTLVFVGMLSIMLIFFQSTLRAV